MNKKVKWLRGLLLLFRIAEIVKFYSQRKQIFILKKIPYGADNQFVVLSPNISLAERSDKFVKRTLQKNSGRF